MTANFKPYEGNEPYIFVSYSHRDSELVFPIVQALHDRGLRIWYDMGIDPGSEWPEEIATHLLGCGLFLLFMSPDAAESHNVRREITMAVDRKKPLMNVYIRETELQPGLQLQLNLIQYVSYVSRDAEPFDDFIERLTTILLKKAPDIIEKAVTPVTPTTPATPTAYASPTAPATPTTPTAPAAHATYPPPAAPATTPVSPQPPQPYAGAAQQGAAKAHHSKLPIFILSGAIALLAIVLAFIFLFSSNDEQDGAPGEGIAQVSPAGSSEATSGTNGSNEPNGSFTSPTQPSQGGTAELIMTQSGTSYYITLTGASGSIKFTNIFPDKLTMPEMVTKVNVNYVVLDPNNEVTDYRYNERNLPGSIDPGHSVIISLYDDSATTDLYFPVDLLDTAITVAANTAPAVHYVTLDGGSIQFANVSDERRDSPKRASNARIDYVIYESDGEVVDYGSNDTARPALNGGERIVISQYNTTDTIVFFFPEMWQDSVLTVTQSDERTLRHIPITGTGSVTFTNISDTRRDAIKSVNWSIRVNFVVYNSDGNVISYHNSATGLEPLEPGHTVRVSVSDPSQTATYYYATETIDKVYEVKESSEPALRHIPVSGTGSVTFTNISDTRRDAIKSVNWSIRVNFVVYNSDGDVISYHASATGLEPLEPGHTVRVSVSDPSQTATYYYDAETIDKVYEVKESSEPALHFVTLAGNGNVEFTNISSETHNVPGVLSWSVRRNYTIYDADGNEQESRENSTNHGSRLNPGFKLQISLADASNSTTFFFPTEWLDTVFAVSIS